MCSDGAGLGRGEAAGQVLVGWYPLVIYNYLLEWIDQTLKIDWYFQTYIIVELHEDTTKNMRRQSVLLGQAPQNNVWQQSVGENQLPHIYLSTAYNELIICIVEVATVFISCWEL